MKPAPMQVRPPAPPGPYHRGTPLREVMVRDVIAIQLHDKSSLVDVLMKHHPIHHLPVLDGEVLRGLIAQRDLYRSMLSALYYEDERELHAFLDDFTDVASIMTAEPLTLGPEDTLGAALELMLEHKIGCVPVVDERNRLLGILTDSDLLRVLQAVLPG
jgi:CBS domain-containing protein